MSQYGSSFAKHYDLMYSWKDYASESDIIVKLVEKHGNGGRKLLEVACGTGNYLALLKEKFDVTGLDLSAEMLSVAAKKLPGIKLMQGSMKNFKLEETFDVITCLFSSIAYMKSEEELKQAVHAFYDHLKKDGIAIVEGFVDPDKYMPGHIGVLNTEAAGAKLSRHNVTVLDGNVCRLRMHTLVSTREGTEHFVEDHDMTLFEPDAVIRIMEEAGFEVERIESGLMKDRSLYVCKKKK